MRALFASNVAEVCKQYGEAWTSAWPAFTFLGDIRLRAAAASQPGAGSRIVGD